MTTNEKFTLYGAWLASDLAAAIDPRDGGPFFLCPACDEVLTISPAACKCERCSFQATGEAKAMAAVAAKAARPKGQGDGKALWTLKELFDYVPDPEAEIWIGGALAQGEPAGFIGAPGVGKSRATLQAAMETIMGVDFLGWKTNAYGKPWLFLQTENSARRLAHDVKRMLVGLAKRHRRDVREMLQLMGANLKIMNIEADVTGTIYCPEGSEDRLRIEKTIAELDPAVVVFDPLRDALMGDPNKDEHMSQACKDMRDVVRNGNPKRTALVVHHGRTGGSEASKVFGDDAQSFGRGSKALNGWLRSQINMAPGGEGYENIAVVGCGKSSNGKPWKPFAIELDEQTMLYKRRDDVNLEEWAGEKASGKRKEKPKPVPTAEDVARIVRDEGGEIMGGERSPEGLCQRIQEEFHLSRDAAKGHIRDALGKTIQYRDGITPTGKPTIVYLEK